MGRRLRFGEGWVGVVMIALASVLAISAAVRLAGLAAGGGDPDRMTLFLTVLQVVFYAALCIGLIVARRRLRSEDD